MHLSKLYNEVMSWILGAYEYHYSWPLPEANSTTVHDLTALSVSSLPLPVIVRSRFIRSIGMEFWTARVQIWTSICSIQIFGIWPQASKQADIHIHVRNAVTLVWGLLRLAPITISLLSVYTSACDCTLGRLYHDSVHWKNTLFIVPLPLL